MLTIWIPDVFLLQIPYWPHTGYPYRTCIESNMGFVLSLFVSHFSFFSVPRDGCASWIMHFLGIFTNTFYFIIIILQTSTNMQLILQNSTIMCLILLSLTIMWLILLSSTIMCLILSSSAFISRKHANIILTHLNPLLYSKIRVYRGIHYLFFLFLFC